MENEIVEGIKLLAETEGIFTETAGGVVISGLKRLVERRDESAPTTSPSPTSPATA